jgi:hypothetical protein
MGMIIIGDKPNQQPTKEVINHLLPPAFLLDLLLQLDSDEISHDANSINELPVCWSHESKSITAAASIFFVID